MGILMGIEDCFETTFKERIDFINECIINKLPKNEIYRKKAKETAIKIADNYQGIEKDALAVLSYAAKQGMEKFDEYAKKLEEYSNFLKSIEPKNRRDKKNSTIKKLEKFFSRCYEEIKISEINIFDCSSGLQ